MVRRLRWLAVLCLFHPVVGQEVEAIPDSELLPLLDVITPVPPPEIPLLAPGPAQWEMPKELEIKNEGGSISGDLNTGILTLGGPIHIKGDNGLNIFGDRATIDTKAKVTIITGDVSIYQGNLFQRGESVTYDYALKKLDTRGLRASIDPILLESGKFTTEQRGDRQVYVGYDAGITTHDAQNPGYWVRADKTTIYPGEKVVFEDLKLYAGDTPFFWLPYLSQPLDQELGYHFTPGARSDLGIFLKNRYGIMLGGDEEENWLLSRWNVDLFSKRGIGLGVDLVDTREENLEELPGFSFYYLNDMNPKTTRNGLPRVFTNEDRYTLSLKNQYELFSSPSAEWTLASNLTWLSDRYYLEDFNRAIFRNNPSPDNTLGIFRRDDESLFGGMVRYQVNDFYRADERLPEISYDRVRRPLFDLPILHEGRSSLGLIGERMDHLLHNTTIKPLSGMLAGDPNAPALLAKLTGYEKLLAEEMINQPLGSDTRRALERQLHDSSYFRLDTYQELSYQLELGNFLQLTPKVGAGYTRYDSVDGPLSNSDRLYGHAGLEASMKFSKSMSGYRDEKLGIDGLLHVVQPYAAWSVMAVDDYDRLGPDVDRLSPSTRPRPLDPMRFTAVDDLRSWNILRVGARNRLITRRDQQNYEWLYLDTYVDAFMQDPEGDRRLSNLYNKLRWAPVPWLKLDVDTQFPIASTGSGYEELNTQIRYQPYENFEFALGYRMLSGHPVLIDSNHVSLETYSRFRENWGFGTLHELEMDDGTLEFEQYSLHHDMGNWVASVGFNHRDNRLEEEFGVIFSLSFKELPGADAPIEFNNQP